jgi:azurin
VRRAFVLVIGLLATLMFVVAACGDDATATAVPKPRATNTPVPTIAAPTATTAPATATTAPTAAPATPTEAPDGPETVSLEISVNGDALAFDKSEFSAGAGSEVVLTFSNVSIINQHNWVIVQPGTKDDVAARGTAAGPDNDWVQPDDPDVIANTKLLDAGATGEVTFAAPPAGTYQFVCTFPGHNFTMFGDFEVTG